MPPPELWIWLIAVLALAIIIPLLLYAQRQARSRRRLKRALTKQIRRNRQHEETRNHFLAAIGHDLRQPLQAAGMYAEVLNLRLCQTDLQPVVDRLVQSIDSTGRLLSTLIDVTTMECGDSEPSPTTIDLGHFLPNIFQQMEVRALSKNLRFKLHAVDQMVVSDPVLLERIVRNLLVNALTYTENGGVLLGCRIRPNQIGIQVVDTGIGIAEPHLDQIFEDFIRLGPQTPDGNLGLGLSIVRQTAQLLGHQVEVKSKVGKGSCFTVWVDRL